MIRFGISSWVTDEDLREVNTSSLLFDCGTEICYLDFGNIGLSLMVNGEVKIVDENTGDIYKSYSQYPKKLVELIKSGKNIENYGYIIDMNNWFEMFVDKIDENGNAIEGFFYEVVDIEEKLDNNSLRRSLFEFMIRFINDYIDIKDIDLMTISDNERLLLKDYEIKRVFSNYTELAKIKKGVEDENVGRKLFMSNLSYVWVEIKLKKNLMESVLFEVEKR